jgi:hypothetical protein
MRRRDFIAGSRTHQAVQSAGMGAGHNVTSEPVLRLARSCSETPSPSRARRKIRRTVSAWMGSISKIFLVRWPCCSAASTMR